MGDFVQHEACPGCGSSDGLARYADGSAHCFACKDYNEKKGGSAIEQEAEAPRDWTPMYGDIVALPKRGLDKKTLEFCNYQVGDNCQIANYYVDNALSAQKLRLPGKEFRILGNGKKLPLYLQWKWSGGKHMTITEGEHDAHSMLQAFDLKWPVTSLQYGAASVERSIEEAYEFLDRYERIVLMFDMDKPGREAAQKAAAMLPPGKAAIALLPHKDANEVLLKEGPAKLIRAFWDAPIWKPDGIVDGAEFTLDKVRQAAIRGFTLPYPGLNERILGLRKGELTLLTAGSGIGKSSLAREIGYLLHEDYGQCIGNVFLEENNVKTAQGYVGIDNNVPLGKLRADPDLLTEEQWKASLERVVQKRMLFYNHFGSLDSKNLIAKLRYMATVCKVDFIILDHISIVTSGLESSSEGERKDIDILMTRLRSLIEETGIGIIAIVHLKRVNGKNFNEGAQVSLNDLRGSASLEQLSDNVIALERNQQVEDE